jgi:hypothetical protein
MIWLHPSFSFATQTPAEAGQALPLKIRRGDNYQNIRFLLPFPYFLREGVGGRVNLL